LRGRSDGLTGRTVQTRAFVIDRLNHDFAIVQVELGVNEG
jgi:hypothetical protein